MKILITGGASGLGAAIVKRLAADMTNTVYFTYASSAAAAKDIENEFANASALFCDFKNELSLDELLRNIPALDVDILINNANGGIHKEHFYKTDPAVFINSFEHNILPALKITQEAFKVFRKKKAGRIINIISSAIVNKPPAGWSSYTADKAYLLSMSKSWASEGIRSNITSNSISPSFMVTKLTADTDERIIEQMTDAHPLKRLLTVEEVANAVVFFTECSPHINGTNLVINAGGDVI